MGAGSSVALRLTRGYANKHYPMKFSISTTYDLIRQIKGHENYKFTKDGICINTHRSKLVKRTLNGSTSGYCINGRFMSDNQLRPQLERITEIDCPF